MRRTCLNCGEKFETIDSRQAVCDRCVKNGQTTYGLRTGLGVFLLLTFAILPPLTVIVGILMWLL